MKSTYFVLPPLIPSPPFLSPPPPPPPPQVCLHNLASSMCVSISYINIFTDQDERENPEDIPEYELKLRGCMVMCTNYSFLWQYLEPSRLLPILVDKLLMTERAKKEVELYAQKFAQNPVVIHELFASDCPPLKLCDTLDVTGQGHIARKLLHGT